MSIWYRRLVWFATGLALFVVVLGAYVRLTDAGLGCPDWPGCYGSILPTDIDNELAGSEWPERPVETGKAWREMVHRYVASILGFAIVLIALLAWRNRGQQGQPVKVPLLTLGVVIFQGLLGMWTVTLLLKPIIVMGHLLGGLTTLGLLFWLLLENQRYSSTTTAQNRRLAWPAVFALIILITQVALGGWVSSNYAALACPDLPTCMGQWWPEQADFAEGFVMWRGLGVNYEFGILEAPARVAIHFTHRLGAITATLVLLFITSGYWRTAFSPAMRGACITIWVALAAQLSLGLAAVGFGLPLAVATAHNGIAAVLLLSVINLNNVASRIAP
ncbi:MAG: heme A synthase [Gammaproteobacteria bacterium]|nr:MAG: heme A synthase [Gammaproteobacteria bacterium]